MSSPSSVQPSRFFTGRVYSAWEQKAAWLFLLVVVAIIAAGIRAFEHYAGDLRASVERELLAISALKRAQIEDLFDRLESDALIVVRRPPIQAALESPGPEARAGAQNLISSLTQAAAGTRGYRRTILFDRGLNDVIAQAPMADEAIVHAVRDSIATGRPALVDLSVGSDGIVRFGRVQPIRREGGAAVIGALYFELDAGAKLLSIVEAWPYPTPTAESFLARRDGSDLLYMSALRHRGRDAPLSMRLPLSTPNLLGARVVANESLIQNAVDYRGEPVIGVGVPIGGTGWHLVSKIDVSEAEQEISLLRNIITGLSALLLAMAALFFVFALRYHRRESKIRETALERQFRISVDTSIDGFVRLGSDHRITEVNAAMEALTGFAATELIGQGVDLLEAVQSPEQTHRDLENIRTRGKARFQTRWRRKDGGLIDVDISAVYVASDAGEATFSYVRDVTAERRARLRLERHGRLNEFLNELTLPLLTIREPKALLEALCAAAVRHERFLLVRAGYLADDGRTLSALVHAGALGDRLGGIAASVDGDHPEGQLPAAVAWRERRSVLVSDYQNDPRTAPRHAAARELGIRASFSMPVLREGVSVAVVTFYAADRDFFDTDMVALLEEAGRNLALAWEAGRLAEERDDEHSARTAMESRFERIVSAVPVPIQIHDVRTKQVISINHAHERAFGYSLEEIGADNGWFTRAYPDAAERERLRSSWLEAMEVSRTQGIATASPEVRVRCSDGTDRVMLSRMTITGNDAIVIWSDLTDAKTAEARAAVEARIASALLDLPRLADSLSESEFMQRGIELAEELSGSRISFIHLVDPDENAIGLVTWSRRTQEEYCRAGFDRHYPVSKAGIWADAVRQRRAIVFNDYASYPEKRGLPDGHASLQRLISVPVLENGRVVMLAGVGNKPQDYSDLDLEAVQRVANEVWRNVHRRRAALALQASELRFRALVERSASAFFAVREGRIIYANPRMAEMMHGDVDGLLGRNPSDVVPPHARAVLEGVERRIAAGERSVSAQLPVRRLDGKGIVLDIHGLRGSWDDATAFIYTATDVTERVRAEERINEYIRRLEHSLRATLEAVSRMVDLRDPYTSGHERRVGLIASAIAGEMGWDAERCSRLELLGLVHDIGKIAIPAELLSKPSRLTAIEHEMVKAHAQAGYDILKDVPFEFPVAEIVRQHHERLDGSGYPRGLKGDEILPEARVLAVADVLESMASHRPYRPAVGLDAAVEELQRKRGTFYDAAVVDAAIRLVRDRGYALPS